MDSELTSLLSTLGIVFGIAFLIILIILIPAIIAEWKLFKKAGKPGWAAIVPFYNTWVLIEIAGLNWWYFLITLFGGVVLAFLGEAFDLLSYLIPLYINFIVYYNIAKKMKQDPILYGILSVFLPYVTVLILGFSKSIQYDSSVEVSPNGVF